LTLEQKRAKQSGKSVEFIVALSGG
jgi:hypothetical protein